MRLVHVIFKSREGKKPLILRFLSLSLTFYDILTGVIDRKLYSRLYITVTLVRFCAKEEFCLKGASEWQWIRDGPLECVKDSLV